MLDSELPCPTALGATRPSLVEDRVSCFCVGTCTRRHSGFRLCRRLPFTGGSECPTPTRWTLDHNRRCALLVALEHRRRRGEHRTTPFDRRGSKRGGENASNSRGRCIPSLLRSLCSLRGGRGLSALTAEAKNDTDTPPFQVLLDNLCRSLHIEMSLFKMENNSIIATLRRHTSISIVLTSSSCIWDLHTTDSNAIPPLSVSLSFI